MSPAEADECELWQLAAVLGLDAGDPEVPDDPLDALAARIAAEKDTLAERARIAETSRPAGTP